MELKDSSGNTGDAKPEFRPVLFGIDLNEIPSPSCETLLLDSPDAYAVVRAFHDNPTPPPGGPACLPGEVRGSVCSACGRPEVRGSVVVCDGCERGFHLSCAGMRGRQAIMLDDWTCVDCVRNGAGSKRWPLGAVCAGPKRSGVRLLDINASPPSDGEAEGSDGFLNSRMHTPDDSPFIGNRYSSPVAYSNLWCASNGFDLQKTSSITVHHRLTVDKSFDEADLNSTFKGRLRITNNTDLGLQSRNPNEMFLQALREYIYERHGVLEEGWHVEFRQCMNQCETLAVYCAPDGKRFESMFDVAYHLGLVSNCSSLELEDRNDMLASASKVLHLRRRQKELGKLSSANSSTANQEILTTSCGGELSSDVKITGTRGCVFGSNARITEAMAEKNGGSWSQQLNDGLPVQYEDFFVLCLGSVDMRQSYHDTTQVWPVGYKSCWHDKITGSLFVCDVSDGGDAGPIFKVRRSSCLAVPIPNGLTVLLRTNCGQSDCQQKVEGGNSTISIMDYDEDDSIQMILADPCPLHLEHDFLSSFGSSLNVGCDAQSTNSLQTPLNCLPKPSGKLLSDKSESRDDIGEFLVEGRSSSLVWRAVSQRFIDACRKIYNNTSFLQFFCNHSVDGMSSKYSNVLGAETNVSPSSLTKFCSSLGPVNFPHVIRCDRELNALCEALAKWLEQDRFGLDMEFVQEFIEQFPEVRACSRYEFLNKRSYYSTSQTVGNGFLLAKRKCEIHGEEEVGIEGLLRGCKRSRKQTAEDLVMDDHRPPPGKPLSSKLPLELVGDVLQVWELLWRFNEILGIKEPFSFEELEEELVSPWFDSLNFLEKFEKEIQEGREITSQKSDGTSGHTLSASIASDPPIPGENAHAFIKVETVSTKEAAQAKLASRTYSRCTGIALTKAHSSLLKVLVGELQSKVAALVDPNFDSGESKSRRGRRKDSDNLVSTKKMKLDMLPINELTWPELARRYILTVSCMDCHLDSAEVISRESGKVFRCLRGDGGVLCGSLTGVAGMETDALLLAEATKKIFGSVKRDYDALTIDCKDSDSTGACEMIVVNGSNIPDWAQALEPVRKLPTNVGTRIRKCIYDALNKGPPEWAEKILTHSISKEVYKGNASGPTKKAALLVLADVYGEGVHQKPDKERKGKRVRAVSDIIMKQCRIVLRHAIAADEAKVFCNLLGRSLSNPIDNDDEGLLGSPAMVSRPLDFRTIDLRLAVGAYGGSHEAFLEDVREVWHNIRTAFGERPDLMPLAETLSQNFESLYEQEVLTLVQKLVGYSNVKSLSAEAKKEMDDILVCASEIPKAPWDDGVCKVCGIDKDDDSVLLCDKCDSEYHTYCLNPPLARIPEGNWYCPSCLAGQCKTQHTTKRTEGISRSQKKRYQGEGTSVFSEALIHLASIMKEKEYWEFNVEERIFLLKFLCEEVLNSGIIREHLEKCADMSADLQQKLRSLSGEWRNLKLREDILTAKAAKINAKMLNIVGEAGTEGLANVPTTHGRWTGHLHTSSDSSNYYTGFPYNLLQLEDGPEGNRRNVFNRHSGLFYSRSVSEKHCIAKTQDIQSSFAESRRKDESNRQNEQPFSAPQLQGITLGRESSIPSNLNEKHGLDMGRNGSMPNVEVSQAPTHLAEHVPPMPVSSDNQFPGHPCSVQPDLNESQVYNLEINSLQNEISLLQDSIASQESQLLTLSIRREFLGRDSAGRLYWALPRPGTHPCLVVDGSVAMQQKGRELKETRDPVGNSSCAPFGTETLSSSRESNTSSSYANKFNNGDPISSPWFSYQTDMEIQQLIGWLRDRDPRERELKDSIMQWQRMNSQDSQQAKNDVQDESQATLSKSEKTLASDGLTTRAAIILEKKYGSCLEPETIDIPKKRGRKAKVSLEERTYRCECLEPVWSSRQHCLSCHQTFSTSVELEGHNDGKCNSGPLASENSKENDDPLKGKGMMRSETTRKEYSDEMDIDEASKIGRSEISSRLIRFEKKGTVCPYDFEQISAKFVTATSIKETVQEIGLIGSNGVPSFVPSVSPYLSDSTLLLVPTRKDGNGPGDGPVAVEKQAQPSQGNSVTANTSYASIFINSPSCAENGINEQTVKTNGCTSALKNERDQESFHNQAPDQEAGHFCMVPESSLQPLAGKISQILRRLKINLLDMDAALPEEALRSSKAQLAKRCAWRAYVKSAESMFEMIQATIILEEMIKAEYLRNGWCYWSSLSAAAKTSTVSSLALRIYSLDDAIVYEKTLPSLDQTDNSKPGSKTNQKIFPSLDPTEKPKPSKKRKDSEG